MTQDLLVALVAYAFASSITPGPNNLMLMTSGANFGFARTVPHMLGVSLGFGVMAVLVGLGLGRVFTIWPVAFTVLKIAAVVYLLYLAWKIATAAAPDRARATGTPFTFLQAAAFQWVNPKAWGMAVTATTAYVVQPTVGAVLIVAVVFSAINLPSVGTWVMLGGQATRLLTNPRRLRAFNVTMAVLLVASLWPVLAP